jgi:transcriptional regulator with XRE-family HTH domain
VQTLTFDGLGRALRWLRDRQGKKQYQVADTAGITKGMLSSYETGRQRPSIDTLDKILDTLGCDLNDLHNALRIVHGQPAEPRRRSPLWEDEAEGRGATERSAAEDESTREELYRILGRQRLPAELEQAFTEMLAGFHRWIRYMHQTLQRATQPDRSGPFEG